MSKTPVPFSPENIKTVASLYRRSLRTAADWINRRDFYRAKAAEIRHRFEQNRNVSDPQELKVICDQQVQQLQAHIYYLKMALITSIMGVLSVTLYYNLKQYNKDIAKNPKPLLHIHTLRRAFVDMILNVRISVTEAVKFGSGSDQDRYYNDAIIDQYYEDDSYQLQYCMDEVTGDLVKFEPEVLSSTTDPIFDSPDILTSATVSDDLRVIVEKAESDSLHAYIFDRDSFKTNTMALTTKYLLKEPVDIDQYLTVCYSGFDDQDEGAGQEEEVDYSELKPNLDVFTLEYYLTDQECNKFEDINTLRKLMSLEDVGDAIYPTIVAHTSFICYLIQTTPNAQFRHLMFKFVRDLITYETDNSLDLDRFALLINCIFSATRSASEKQTYNCGVKTLYATLGAVAVEDFIEGLDFWFVKEAPNYDLELELLKLVLLKNLQALSCDLNLFDTVSDKIKSLLSRLPESSKVSEMRLVWDAICCYVGNENSVHWQASQKKPMENKRKCSVALDPIPSPTKKFKGLRSSNRNDFAYT
ncbi:hypothetical protein KL929_001637 [Ogataea haglerorum]|uniref:uncharacterized protein n=1 Tax=Ogataea haglerorum TaxID=1937702 RepID=UPI001C8A9CE2|nr:uncharacterized protein KL911_000272 [Ogataea haglerorum]KAG7700692.1 hypothetical protein KL951_000807 [Ogataea haglerorum]KAG7759135.1 hypothetical protein KL911_000272 [Ogataea haglerorum]KAG7798594.1 hypothetical protein KL929_001637 [Ogataea haglerorum]